MVKFMVAKLLCPLRMERDVYIEEEVISDILSWHWLEFEHLWNIWNKIEGGTHLENFWFYANLFLHDKTFHFLMPEERVKDFKKINKIATI